jgi:phage baseplate assembly protein W
MSASAAQWSPRVPLHSYRAPERASGASVAEVMKVNLTQVLII